MIKRIDHIAIVVEDIEASLGFWRDKLGLDLSHMLQVPEQQAAIAFLPTGGSEVELVQPTTTDSGLARYLGKRGPGIHHICFEVDDIAANTAQPCFGDRVMRPRVAVSPAEMAKMANISMKFESGVGFS